MNYQRRFNIKISNVGTTKTSISGHYAEKQCSAKQYCPKPPPSNQEHTPRPCGADHDKKWTLFHSTRLKWPFQSVNRPKTDKIRLKLSKNISNYKSILVLLNMNFIKPFVAPLKFLLEIPFQGQNLAQRTASLTQKMSNFM